MRITMAALLSLRNIQRKRKPNQVAYPLGYSYSGRLSWMIKNSYYCRWNSLCKPSSAPLMLKPKIKICDKKITKKRVSFHFLHKLSILHCMSQLRKNEIDSHESQTFIKSGSPDISIDLIIFLRLPQHFLSPLFLLFATSSFTLHNINCFWLISIQWSHLHFLSLTRLSIMLDLDACASTISRHPPLSSC